MLIAFEGPLWPRLEVLTFAALLVTACVTDLRTRRIPNQLVVFGVVAGLALAMVTDGVVAGGGRALGGFAAGMAIWLPFWLLHMMGGGDVKFFAAGAMWLGPHGAVEAAMLAGLCGGALSLVYLVAQHGFTHTLIRLSYGMQHPSLLRVTAPAKWDRRMPYALAMAAGLAGAARWPGLLL